MRRSTARTTRLATSSFGNPQEDVMRTSFFAAVAALLLLAGPAAAQQDAAGPGSGQQDVAKTTAAANPEFGPVNQIDFGVRGTIFGSNSDEARYQRYRDLRDGGTIDRF